MVLCVEFRFGVFGVVSFLGVFCCVVFYSGFLL